MMGHVLPCGEIHQFRRVIDVNPGVGLFGDVDNHVGTVSSWAFAVNQWIHLRVVHKPVTFLSLVIAVVGVVFETFIETGVCTRVPSNAPL